MAKSVFLLLIFFSLVLKKVPPSPSPSPPPTMSRFHRIFRHTISWEEFADYFGTHEWDETSKSFVAKHVSSSMHSSPAHTRRPSLRSFLSPTSNEESSPENFSTAERSRTVPLQASTAPKMYDDNTSPFRVEQMQTQMQQASHVSNASGNSIQESFLSESAAAAVIDATRVLSDLPTQQELTPKKFLKNSPRNIWSSNWV